MKVYVLMFSDQVDREVVYNTRLIAVFDNFLDATCFIDDTLKWSAVRWNGKVDDHSDPKRWVSHVEAMTEHPTERSAGFYRIEAMDLLGRSHA